MQFGFMLFRWLMHLHLECFSDSTMPMTNVGVHCWNKFVVWQDVSHKPNTSSKSCTFHRCLLHQLEQLHRCDSPLKSFHNFKNSTFYELNWKNAHHCASCCYVVTMVDGEAFIGNRIKHLWKLRISLSNQWPFKVICHFPPWHNLAFKMKR